jgi:hypothetical protein
MDGEKMSLTVFQLISVAAGLALLAADYMVVYLFSPKMKFLKGCAGAVPATATVTDQKSP